MHNLQKKNCVGGRLVLPDHLQEATRQDCERGDKFEMKSQLIELNSCCFCTAGVVCWDYMKNKQRNDNEHVLGEPINWKENKAQSKSQTLTIVKLTQ